MSLYIIILPDEKLKNILNEFKEPYILHDKSFLENKSEILSKPNANHIFVNAYLSSERYEYYCIAKRFRMKYGVMIESDKAESLRKHDIPINELKNYKKSTSTQKRIVSSDFQSKLTMKIKELNKKYGVDSVNEEVFMKIVNVAEDLDNLEEIYEKIIIENKKR